MFCHRFISLFIIGVSLLVAVAVSAQPVKNVSPKQRISTSFSAGDGKLCLYNYHEDRAIEVNYRKGKRYRQKGLDEIQYLFRSRSDKQEHPIDIELIELLDHLQDHFAVDCVELISGYRSPKLNKELKEKNVNVSEESLHLEGRAADIHLDEVTEEIVSSYARSLKVGGVGYYPAFDFVHIDTGDVRRWDLPDRPGRLLMAMRKGAKWQVITDRNLYLPDEVIDVEVMNITRAPRSFDSAITVERFRRGKWEPAGTLSIPNAVQLAPGEVWRTQWKPEDRALFGKFRLVLPGPDGFPHLAVHSNEFYRKRR